MRNKHILWPLLLAALTLVWGCGSDDDDTIEDPTPVNPVNPKYVESSIDAAPTWQLDWYSDETTPDWESQQPNPKDFETWSIVVVKLDEALAPYASADDMMAVFINNEMRAFARCATREDGSFVNDAGEVFFILKILGNEDSENNVGFALKYYSSQLHQTFTRMGYETFEAEKTYGISEDFMPSMTSGSSKYPVQMELTLRFANLTQSDFVCNENDIVAVFVGDECRGVSHADAVNPWSNHTLYVYGRKENEVATVCYYSYEKQSIITFTDRITLNNSEKKTFDMYL